MWIWFASRMKSYAWIRRSLSFKGLIYHFGTAHHGGFRRGVIIEYIPPKNDLGTRKNMLLIFQGSYRVWEFRAVRVRRFKTMAEAMEVVNGSK